MKKLSLFLSPLTILAMTLVSCTNTVKVIPDNNNNIVEEYEHTPYNTTEITDLTLINFSGEYKIGYLIGYSEEQQGRLEVKDHVAKFWKNDSNEYQEKPIYVYKVPFNALPKTLQKEWKENGPNDYYVFNHKEISNFTLTFSHNIPMTGFSVKGADYFGYLSLPDYCSAMNPDTAVTFYLDKTKAPTGSVTVSQSSLTPYNLEGPWKQGLSKAGNGKIKIDYNGYPEIHGEYYSYIIDKNALPLPFLAHYDTEKDGKYIIYKKTPITDSFTLSYKPTTEYETSGLALNGADLIGYEVTTMYGRILKLHTKSRIVQLNER